jgi:mono/diheme cytochrome c family protein
VGYCHGVAGAAGRGPRLRGRTFPKDYLDDVIRNGIPSSAMPAWKDRLKENEIRAVEEYVASLSSARDAAPPANPMPPGVGPAAIASFNGPPQAGSGHALFFDLSRQNCGICHSVGGRGVSIGPDLAAKSSDTILSAIHGTRSSHLLTAKLKSGEEFPALLAEQNGNVIRLYDLTIAPPVLRSLERSEVASLVQNPSWRHEDFVKDYSSAELEDVVAYLRWAITKK